MFDFGKVPPTSLSGISPLGPDAPSPPELKARDLKDAKSIQSYLENNIEPWLKSHQGNFSSSEHRKISSDLQSIVHELSSSTSPLHEALEKFDDLMLGMGFVVPHTLRAEGMALAAEGMQNRALSAFSSVKQSLAALQTDLKAAQSACVSTKGEKELDKASKMLSQAYSRLGHLSSLESKIHMDMDSLNKAIDVCTKSSSDKMFNDAKQSFSILETSTEALSYQVGNIQQQDIAQMIQVVRRCGIF